MHKVLICDCLTPCKQRTKISKVTQGSIVGSLLFSIDICDLFFNKKNCDIGIYGDDNTPYLSEENVEEILNGLENVSSNLFHWFT